MGHVAGEPTRASNAPTLADISTAPGRYLTGAGELRGKYLGGEEGQDLRAQRRLEAVIRGLDMPEGEDAYKADLIELIPSALKAAAETGVPASVLLGVAGQESAYGTNTGPSSAQAQGDTQFIPSTRQYMIDKYGVDPWADHDSGMLAAGLYLKELGFMDDPQAALSSYSGGYEEDVYNNPILTRADTFSPIDKFVGKVSTAGNDGATLASAPGGGGRHQLSVNELFYDPGTSLVDNQPTGAIGGHSDHAHFGSENQRDLLHAAAIAERLGLDIRENPLFETVDPVHTTNSLHYDEEPLKQNLRARAEELGSISNTIGAAIDVTGDPASLARFDERIASLAGAPVTAESVSGGTSYPALSSPGGVPGSTGATIQSSLTRTSRVPSSGGGETRPQAPPTTVAENPLAARASLPEPYLERTADTQDDNLSSSDIYDTLLGRRRLARR